MRASYSHAMALMPAAPARKIMRSRLIGKLRDFAMRRL